MRVAGFVSVDINNSKELRASATMQSGSTAHTTSEQVDKFTRKANCFSEKVKHSILVDSRPLDSNTSSFDIVSSSSPEL